MPRVTRVAVLLNPDNPGMGPVLEAMEGVARSLKLELQQFEVRGPGEFDSVFSAMAKRRADALHILGDGMLITNAGRIADLAAKNRLAGTGFKEFVEGGGLMAYAVNFPDIWRRAAVFADKILKGAKPADLPVEQPTNKTLGLTIPQSILIRADRVIQ